MTAIGFVQLLCWPQFYAPLLAGSAFEGQFGEAAVLLGVLRPAPAASGAR